MTGDLETSSITWGDTRLPYVIRRSARRKKTVAVTVDPSGAVLLVAPKDFSTSRLDAVARRKAAWIVQRLRHVQSHDPPLSRREFVSGETVLYLGRHYRLKVHPNGPGEAKLRGGWLHVPAPARSATDLSRPGRPRVLVPPSCGRASAGAGEGVAVEGRRRAPRVVIADQQKRWGVATVAVPSG